MFDLNRWPSKISGWITLELPDFSLKLRCQGCQWSWECIFSSQISSRPTNPIFVKWELEYIYIFRHTPNENVNPCVDLGVYSDFPNRMLGDHCWFTEQIAKRNLSIQMDFYISRKDQYGAYQTLPLLSVPEQTFALFKVWHHSGDGKRSKNMLHVYIPCV